jgi:nucleoside-diphosphate-sugar epimerase
MRVLVTGGGGFIGKAVVRALLDRGWTVRTLSRGAYPELEAWGVEAVRGDLGDLDDVVAAVRGCDAVVHVAAKPGVWGRYADYHRTNVEGTDHVIRACIGNGVRTLVYTSTPSVAHGGGDLRGVDESAPYAEGGDRTHYQRTKIEAEKLVLAANTPALQTVALRPHLVWGPGDPNFMPRLIERARAGRLRLVDGGAAKVDVTYIDTAAHAHLLALDQLLAQGADAPCAGKAYFISQGEPVEVGAFINALLETAGLPPVTRSVSGTLAYWAGYAMEAVWTVLQRTDEPPMTRFVARQLSTDHYYDISAARRDLSFEPVVSIDEGLSRLRGARLVAPVSPTPQPGAPDGPRT